MFKSIITTLFVLLTTFVVAQTQHTSAPAKERIYKGQIVAIQNDSIATFKFDGNEYSAYFILPQRYRGLHPKPSIGYPIYATIFVKGIEIQLLKSYDYDTTQL